VDPAEHKKQEDNLNARLFAQHQKSQERLVELVCDYQCQLDETTSSLTTFID
jgi:outer membrane protein insertion porin family